MDSNDSCCDSINFDCSGSCTARKVIGTNNVKSILDFKAVVLGYYSCCNYIDCLGVCLGSAEYDCNNVCDGSASIDNCGICSGEYHIMIDRISGRLL